MEAAPTDLEIGRSDQFFCGVGSGGEGGYRFFWRSGSPPGFFPESSITLPDFFCKVPELSRPILEKSDNFTGLFRELPAHDRKFSKKSTRGRTDLPGFGNGLRRWGLRPHTPMSQQCRPKGQVSTHSFQIGSHPLFDHLHRFLDGLPRILALDPVEFL